MGKVGSKNFMSADLIENTQCFVRESLVNCTAAGFRSELPLYKDSRCVYGHSI